MKGVLGFLINAKQIVAAGITLGVKLAPQHAVVLREYFSISLLLFKSLLLYLVIISLLSIFM